MEKEKYISTSICFSHSGGSWIYGFFVSFFSRRISFHSLKEPSVTQVMCQIRIQSKDNCSYGWNDTDLCQQTITLGFRIF